MQLSNLCKYAHTAQKLNEGKYYKTAISLKGYNPVWRENVEGKQQKRVQLIENY